LASQLKEIYIDGELEFVDTALWYPKMARKDLTVGMVPMESGVDDPDQMFYENFYTGAQRNYAGYSDPEFDRLVDRQSMESDPVKRKDLVWASGMALIDTRSKSARIALALSRRSQNKTTALGRAAGPQH
jgi:ABC-type transport system substrate-binding protein